MSGPNKIKYRLHAGGYCKLFLIIVICLYSTLYPSNITYLNRMPTSQSLDPTSISFVKYLGNRVTVTDLYGVNIGAYNNNIEISYRFSATESGTVMHNEIVLRNADDNTVVFNKSISLLFDFSTYILTYANGTQLGKLHIFMPTLNLRDNGKELLLANYGGLNTFGRVEYDNGSNWILNIPILVETSGFRVEFEEYGAEHLMKFETKSGIMTQFNPNFMNLDIFDLFGIQWAAGPSIRIADTDFVFEEVKPIDSGNDFWSDELTIIIVAFAAFMGLVLLINQKRGSQRNKRSRKSKGYRKYH